MKNYNKGEKVSIKRCYEIHINGYITDVCPGEVGTVHWDCGDTVEVYFGDFIMLEVNKEDIEPYISEETEEVTIDGWLTRSASGNIVFSDSSECRRGNRVWYHKEGANVVDLDETGLFPNNLFPSLTWESDPLEVTITIKPKNKQWKQ